MQSCEIRTANDGRRRRPYSAGVSPATVRLTQFGKSNSISAARARRSRAGRVSSALVCRVRPRSVTTDISRRSFCARPRQRRLIWSGSLIACLALAGVHGIGLLRRYRTYPTRVQLDVSNRQGMPLPAVTVCPLDRFDLERLARLYREAFRAGEAEPHPVEQYYQLAGVMPIDQLWTRIAYSNATHLFPMVTASITFYGRLFFFSNCLVSRLELSFNLEQISSPKSLPLNLSRASAGARCPRERERVQSVEFIRATELPVLVQVLRGPGQELREGGTLSRRVDSIRNVLHHLE